MKFVEYVKQPTNLIKMICFVFVLGVTRTTLNFRVENNTEDIDSLKSLNLEVSIVQMQTDIAWIRKALEE